MDQNSDNNKQFFDPKNFKTIIVGIGNKNSDSTDLIHQLIDTGHKGTHEEALRRIKKESNALELLVSAIKEKEFEENRNALIAACWESGIDCRPELQFFVDLAIKENYLCCIEATSVIDGMDMPVDQDQLKRAISGLHLALKKPVNDKSELLKQLDALLHSFVE